MKFSRNFFITFTAFTTCTILAVISWAGSTQDSMDHWLSESTPTSAPATAPADMKDEDPPAFKIEAPCGALPGAVEFSDGSVLSGYIVTTGDGPLNVWIEAEKRWCLVPPAAVLGISARIFKEEMFQKPPKNGTGGREAAYPLRQFEWTLMLADGTSLTGTIKGQPLYVYPAAGGDFKTVILHDRQKGKPGQNLRQLVYPKTIIFSRNAVAGK